MKRRREEGKRRDGEVREGVDNLSFVSFHQLEESLFCLLHAAPFVTILSLRATNKRSAESATASP